MTQRLQKILSACGLCSRREAEKWILAGRVTVNGTPAFLGMGADLETDHVEVDGKPVRPPEKMVYIMLNKPRGYVCSLKDEKGRRQVTELVKGCGARVYPVGRLDMDSEGLLLLTNDGRLTHRLTHPSHEVEKTYHVLVSGADIPASVQAIGAMRELEGEAISPAKVQILGRDGAKGKLSVIIHEGKNRQVRRMCAKAGLQVHRLERVAESGLFLGDLPRGHWRPLTEEERNKLQDA